MLLSRNHLQKSKKTNAFIITIIYDNSYSLYVHVFIFLKCDIVIVDIVCCCNDLACSLWLLIGNLTHFYEFFDGTFVVTCKKKIKDASKLAKPQPF